LGWLARTITIVSTVWRPVGPRDPRVYWVRRAVVLAAIVIVIVLVLVLTSGGGSKKPAANKPKPSPTPSVSTSLPVQVVACDPGAIKLVLSTDSDSYTSGEKPKLTGVFSNPTTVACTLASSTSREHWTITSGPDTVWTTQGCTKTTPAKQVKLSAGGTKTVSIFWNGDRLEPGCVQGGVAQPGEYVLRGTLDGVKGTPAIFHVTS
jgi:hypothetical protein